MECNKKTISIPGAEIHFVGHPDYLYAFVTAPKDSVDISLACTRRICQEAESRRMWSVLIEENFPTDVTIADMYEICRKTVKVIPLGIRIAHVKKNTENHDLNIFREIAAANRGRANRVFDTVEEAKKWLTS